MKSDLTRGGLPVMARIGALSKWLYPGMHVKRWLLLLCLSVVMLGLGLAYFLAHLYRIERFPEFVWYITLQFLPRPARGAIFFGAGVSLAYVSLVRLDRSISRAITPGPATQSLAETVYQHRFRQKVETIVVIGGGDGLVGLTNGFRLLGEPLRLVVLPPITTTVMEMSDLHRAMEAWPGGLIPATRSDAELVYEVEEGSRVRSVEGASLVANSYPRVREGRVVGVNVSARSGAGDYKYPVLGHMASIVSASPEALETISKANLIVFGPGSIFTHVLSTLKVPDMAPAIARSQARRVFVCNLMTEPNATAGFTVYDHLKLLRESGGVDVDYVLVNNAPIDNISAQLYKRFDSVQVPLEYNRAVRSTSLTFTETLERTVVTEGAIVVEADLLASPDDGVTRRQGDTTRSRLLVRHDGRKLAEQLVKILESNQ